MSLSGEPHIEWEMGEVLNLGVDGCCVSINVEYVDVDICCCSLSSCDISLPEPGPKALKKRSLSRGPSKPSETASIWLGYP